MTQNAFGHIDGKNLVLRYQAMLDKGLTPKKDVIHIPDFLVWHLDVHYSKEYLLRL